MLFFGFPLLFIQPYPIIDTLIRTMIQYIIGALIIMTIVYKNPRIATHTAEELVYGFTRPSTFLRHIGGMYLVLSAIYLPGALINYSTIGTVDLKLIPNLIAPQPFIALWAYYTYVISRERWRRYITAKKALKAMGILLLLLVVSVTIMIYKTFEIMHKDRVAYEEAVEEIANEASKWGMSCPFVP
jgi:hypothetical protein